MSRLHRRWKLGLSVLQLLVILLPTRMDLPQLLDSPGQISGECLTGSLQLVAEDPSLQFCLKDLAAWSGSSFPTLNALRRKLLRVSY